MSINTFKLVLFIYFLVKAMAKFTRREQWGEKEKNISCSPPRKWEQ
jgi:hypothetical protein